MNDRELLQQYAPVVRYTAGEMFFPCAIEGYLTRCHLWMADADRQPTLLALPGELTPERLATYRSVPRNHRLFLQFVTEPLTAVDYQQWRTRSDRVALPNPSRLQRIGLVTRILDGLFDLSLLVRGRVPGGTAAAAQVQYAEMQADDPRRVYYGRVVRDGGYIVLHYLYFFPMNDWRSSFNGINDHESDWEQVLIYLSDGTDEPEPLWVAFASHDFSGDDLRRRWDDPEVEKVASHHPVIYAGAGSHASYFSRGEYLMNVEPDFLKPVRGVGAAIDRLWTDTLHQGTPLNLESGLRAVMSIPSVDYARGDGRAVGPGQDEAWTCEIISDEVGWVDGYRGLWGLDTWDPLGGERAPAGPKYNRDGSVRLSWRDPLAWAGLDKVLPPAGAPAAMEQLLASLETERAELVEEIARQRRAVRRLELEVESLRSTQFLSNLLRRREVEMAQMEEKLHELTGRLNDVLETQEAGTEQLARLKEGDFGAARAHIQHAHVPQPPLDPPSRFSRTWAAVSGGLILLLIVALVYVRPPYWLLWIVGVAALFGAIDALTRGRGTTYLLRMAIVLALVNASLLAYRFWPLMIVGGLVVLVTIMIRDNLREVFDR